MISTTLCCRTCVLDVMLDYIGENSSFVPVVGTNYHSPITVIRRKMRLTGFFMAGYTIAKAAAFLLYAENGIVKNLIHYLKYKNQQQIGVFLGDWHGELLKDSGDLQVDFVVPVPLHKKKLRKRGYNQVSEFGKRLAFHLGAAFLDTALYKTANTKTQTRKKRFHRWQANQELFAVADTSMLEGASVLLVDDVITTGSTMEACARALHECPGITIYIGAMAVVP